MKRAVIVSILGIFVATAVLLGGCTRSITPTPKAPEQKLEVKQQPSPASKKPGDFFPLSKGSTWQYQGEGNEFAFLSSSRRGWGW